MPGIEAGLAPFSGVRIAGRRLICIHLKRRTATGDNPSGTDYDRSGVSLSPETLANELDNMLRFHTEALNLRARRQELLAANIANADTPGYKARDLDFSKALNEALGGAPAAAGSLVRTAAAHMPPAGGGGA